jgi:hypothetical protein
LITLAAAISSPVPSGPASATLYGAPDGTLYYNGGPSSTAPVPFGGSSYSGADDGAPPPGALNGAPAPPKFYKLEFPTFDGSEDPLNWLNHCEQFFHGQRTLASDRTWFASYHLRGAAQTWYYALEQDEGMPAWERVTEPANYTKLSKKTIHQADDLTNLSPYNLVVHEIMTDFKPNYMPAKIVISTVDTVAVIHLFICNKWEQSPEYEKVLS